MEYSEPLQTTVLFYPVLRGPSKFMLILRCRCMTVIRKIISSSVSRQMDYSVQHAGPATNPGDAS